MKTCCIFVRPLLSASSSPPLTTPAVFARRVGDGVGEGVGGAADGSVAATVGVGVGSDIVGAGVGRSVGEGVVSSTGVGGKVRTGAEVVIDGVSGVTGVVEGVSVGTAENRGKGRGRQGQNIAVRNALFISGLIFAVPLV